MNSSKKNHESINMYRCCSVKTTFKFVIVLGLTIMLTTFSCSKDDSGNNAGINTQNLITTINENPYNGQMVGTVQAVSNQGALSFSITSQTPNGALNINPSSGELTVADKSLFDYETNAVITANVSIIDTQTSASITATINLTDVDDIQSFLSASKADYIDADNGDWLEITEAEYNNLAASLNQVTKVSTSDSDYDMGETGTIVGDVTTANNNGASIPANSFVFAFKYYCQDDNVTTTKVKQTSVDIDNGYADLGANLPSHDTGERFFVLKANNSEVTSEGHLAVYQTTGMGYRSITGRVTHFENGDLNTLSQTTGTTTPLCQGLSTTQKQW